MRLIKFRSFETKSYTVRLGRLILNFRARTLRTDLESVHWEINGTMTESSIDSDVRIDNTNLQSDIHIENSNGDIL
jgi:hypothetical protein